MNKKDLKNLMIVVTRNQKIFIVVDNKLLIGNGSIFLEDYNYDLTNYDDSDYDIIKVYETYLYNLKVMLDPNCLNQHNLIWERPILNSIEKTILEYACSQGYNFITRDEDGEIYVWTTLPYKDVNEWITPDDDSGNMQSLTLFSELFEFIKFEEDAPVSISSLL